VEAPEAVPAPAAPEVPAEKPAPRRRSRKAAAE
jgi:hypothetical protein